MFLEHVYQINPQTYKPIFFTLNNNEEITQLHDWLIMNQQIELFDTIEVQIRELIKLNNPTQKLSEDEYLENKKNI
jgi:hypothetical protein